MLFIKNLLTVLKQYITTISNQNTLQIYWLLFYYHYSELLQVMFLWIS
jgi:hypothetical protein